MPGQTARRSVFELGASLELGGWNLVLGLWNLVFRSAMAQKLRCGAWLVRRAAFVPAGFAPRGALKRKSSGPGQAIKPLISLGKMCFFFLRGRRESF
jgi:hypothetical protein